MERNQFEASFRSLTGHAPFAWQWRLFAVFVRGELPEAVDVPTGLGKTNVIAVWLLALASAPSRVPRRLAYVVNRRTVVDQSTREVEKFIAALRTPALADVASRLDALCSSVRLPGAPLVAVSTLRGQLADNGGWRQDPTRPAIVLGTVDMIGSRLLFSGYGIGRYSRSVHAGLLGKDTLLVHDEAHLEPAFQKLVTDVVREQARTEPARALRVLALTATHRTGGLVHGLFLPADLDDPIVKQRYHSPKRLRLLPAADIASTLASEAERLAGDGGAVLVFVRTLDLLDKVSTALLRANPNSVAVLTGTMRGQERERLVTSSPVFRRFDRESTVEPRLGPAFLVATSAGEVGVNISADHLVCDLSTWDSMVQRFGRVNRFGTGVAEIRVVLPAEKKPATKPFEQRVARTEELLRELPLLADGSMDASPAGLATVPPAARIEGFAPSPSLPPTDEILFDALSMTTPRDLPGRPPVAAWLHGHAEWEPATASVAWRDECQLLIDRPVEEQRVLGARMLAAYPLKPHELLTERADRLLKQLDAMCTRVGGGSLVWVIDASGELEIRSLDDVALLDTERLRGATVLLSPTYGGLTEAGTLDGRVDADHGRPLDVADDWGDGARVRIIDGSPPPGLRRVARVELSPGDESDAESEPRFWTAWVKPRFADDDGSRDAVVPQGLDFHLEQVQRFAASIAERLDLEAIAPAVVVAAALHDLGKNRSVWQRAIGNNRFPERVMAKSNGRGALLDLGHYRHEFGSLHDAEAHPGFQGLPDPLKTLALHLIAAHHGRARPGFPGDEGLDPNTSSARSAATAAAVTHRFEALQREHGRWGLAWLEAVVRAADACGSQVAPNDGDTP